MRDFFYALLSLALIYAAVEPEKFGLWLQRIDTARFSYEAYDTDREPALE